MTKELFYRELRRAIQNYQNNVVGNYALKSLIEENKLHGSHAVNFIEFYSNVPNVQQDNNMMQGDVINQLDAWFYDVKQAKEPKEKKKRTPRPRKKVDKPGTPVRVSRTARPKKKPAAKKQPVKKKK